ncbi:hypothetical protein SteCoe_568 [Stentor coeruleus]|uniref:FGFR1 oncogene partner (FOP) N-terminal dimerisation domain-containing protein n=1 Tax=Stentor coeruleus TaxID=5963 RepID=A0A1R2D3R0_9CILI|nr:hypothetical protein SteCoe_568 [Stentor coeruleus]
MNPNLNEKVRQDLEKRGVLNQIRKLFKDKMTETSNLISSNKPVPIINRPSQFDTQGGQICLLLIQDFLEKFDLKLTSSIFLPETKSDYNPQVLQTLEDALECRSEPLRPLIFEIIERTFNTESEEIIDEDINTKESDHSDENNSDEFIESANSQKYDQSANSLVMNEFDYVENVRQVKKL